jgi:DNA-binding LytR/AlgR family response regulator
MKTKIAIIATKDTCDILQGYIKKLEKFETSYCCENSLTAFTELKEADYDLLFIDTNSEPINGFDFIDSLTYNPRVIMISQSEKHAAKAFDYEALDYLIFPFSFQRFLKSIHKFTSLYNANRDSTHQTPQHNPKLKIRANKTLYTFPEEELLFIESIGDYVKVHTKEKSIMFKYSLQKIEKQLTPNDFIRIHRSYVIAINKIESRNCKHVTINNKVIPIGRTYQQKTRNRLQ